MHLDVTQTLHKLDGDVLTDDRVPAQPLTLGFVVSFCLTAATDEKISGEEKLRRYLLAMRLTGSKGLPVDITVDEAAMIKAVVAKLYGPLVVGQVWLAIEQAAAPKAAIEQAA